MLLTKFGGNRSKHDGARMKRGTVTQNVTMLPEEEEEEREGNRTRRPTFGRLVINLRVYSRTGLYYRF